MKPPHKPRAKKSTPSKSRAKKKPTKKVVSNVPAVVAGEHSTFSTIKRKAAMLDALKLSMAIVAPACEMVGIDRKTHYNWLKDDPGYKAEVEALIERTFDFVETKMVERINAGSDTMLIWYSKTKMKSRGFIERTEVEVTEKPAFIVKDSDKGATKVMDVIHKKTGTDNK